MSLLHSLAASVSPSLSDCLRQGEPSEQTELEELEPATQPADVAPNNLIPICYMFTRNMSNSECGSALVLEVQGPI